MAETGNDRWIHPATILVASDLGDLDRLMPFAFQIGRETGARLLLLHVISSGESFSVDAAGMPYYDPDSAIEYAAKELQTWCAAGQRQGLSCTAIVRQGRPSREIVLAAHQFHIDRLLLGTRGRSKLGKLFLGSVAEQVLRSATPPVITVGPEAHLSLDGNNRKKTVLHATTLGEVSRPNAALACRIAGSQNADLILLHVLPPLAEFARKEIPAELESSVLRELRSLATEGGPDPGLKVEAKVAYGNPTIEILAEAAASHAGLIVLGVRHHSVLENLTRDGTIYRVLAHARCPVLSLRMPLGGSVRSEAENQTLADSSTQK